MYALRDVPMNWLTLIFEQSWQLGEVSDNWREGHTPNFKKGDGTSNPGNHFQAWEQQNVTSSSMRGFTSGRSWLTNLITFYSERINLVDEGREVDVVHIDFSKTSNAFSHKRDDVVKIIEETM